MPGERRLRRLIADLAALHPDDAAAVLSLLKDEERAKVDPLLQEFLTFDKPAASALPACFDETQLSPRLLARINEKDQGVTETVQAALRRLAVRASPAPAPASRTLWRWSKS